MPSFATEAVFALDVPAVATFGLAVLGPFAVCAVAGAAVGRGLGRSFGGGAVSCVVCGAAGGTAGGTTSSVGSGDLSARGKSSGRGAGISISGRCAFCCALVVGTSGSCVTGASICGAVTCCMRWRWVGKSSKASCAVMGVSAAIANGACIGTSVVLGNAGTSLAQRLAGICHHNIGAASHASTSAKRFSGQRRNSILPHSPCAVLRTVRQTGKSCHMRGNRDWRKYDDISEFHSSDPPRGPAQINVVPCDVMLTIRTRAEASSDPQRVTIWPLRQNYLWLLDCGLI